MTIKLQSDLIILLLLEQSENFVGEEVREYYLEVFIFTQRAKKPFKSQHFGILYFILFVLLSNKIAHLKLFGFLGCFFFIYVCI